MNPFKLTLLLFLMLSGLLTGSLFSAEEHPEEKLKATIEKVIDVLYQADDSMTLEQKRNAIIGVLDQSFSFDVLVRRTLGRNWDRLTAEQQKKILSLATDLLIYSYTKEFHKGARPEITFEKPLELAPNKIEISSVVSLSDKKVNLAYRLARLESGWQVYDLLVEGVSLVSNYRKQFDAHFLKKDGAALIAQLEEKLDSL
ncbi:MAG: ABC transporter substrate-binding protein [Verrucomicrobiae bacterium]|nr:ABC transporter substrate-binding protein [Verrucomicrobiae bacterium]